MLPFISIGGPTNIPEILYSLNTMVFGTSNFTVILTTSIVGFGWATTESTRFESLSFDVIIFRRVPSTTVTVKEHLAEFPEGSVILNTLVVTPRGKTLPETNPSICTIVKPVQLSFPTGSE